MKQLIANLAEKMGVSINGNQPYDVKVHDERVYAEIIRRKSLGLGESYMAGWWDCERLDELICKAYTTKIDHHFISRDFLRLLFHSVFNRQSKDLSKHVAEQHYDLGNDLYTCMLGKSMAYTCAYWKDAKNLDEAQFNKYDLICKKANLARGERILDIGCGFGGLAKHAVEHYGCEVVGVSISKEQIKFGKEHCKGLPVTFVFADYRDDQVYNPKGLLFDKIVSVGFCEAVGYKNYRNLMKIVHKNLKERGIFLLHTIGSNVSVKNTDPWVDKYIFPNGMLPSIQQLARASEGLFVVEDWHNFGTDYDKTLMAWFENFDRNWP